MYLDSSIMFHPLSSVQRRIGPIFFASGKSTSTSALRKSAANRRIIPLDTSGFRIIVPLVPCFFLYRIYMDKCIGGLTINRGIRRTCRFCNTSRSHQWLRLMDKDACFPFWSSANAVLPPFLNEGQKPNIIRDGMAVWRWRLDQQHPGRMDDNLLLRPLRPQRTVVTLSIAQSMTINKWRVTS